jgi:hypothetical protein
MDKLSFQVSQIFFNTGVYRFQVCFDSFKEDILKEDIDIGLFWNFYKNLEIFKELNEDGYYYSAIAYIQDRSALLFSCFFSIKELFDSLIEYSDKITDKVVCKNIKQTKISIDKTLPEKEMQKSRGEKKGIMLRVEKKKRKTDTKKKTFKNTKNTYKKQRLDFTDEIQWRYNYEFDGEDIRDKLENTKCEICGCIDFRDCYLVDSEFLD